MYPAGRQMLPVVAFQRRMRPSFPAEAKTVLVCHKQRNLKVSGEQLPRGVPLDPGYCRPVMVT
jgi:hypothetical protein